MPLSGVGLIPRSSSAALSLAPHLDVEFPESLLDDVTIAHKLLAKRSKGSQRGTSISNSSVAQPNDTEWNGQSEESDAFEDTHNGRKLRRENQTSNTWTSSSGEILSDQDETEDRTDFVQEYNRLAKKHGVRSMVPDENDVFNFDANNSSAKLPSWFSRKILRRTSSTQSVNLKADRTIKHKRSISDSLRLKLRKDKLKDKDLQELVRLCGSSLLYLPTEYAAGSLSVPTCFRATAQYLVQHATTARGIFRIPGSHYIVSSLYNHYCTMDDEGEVIAGTVRCPSLPEHIRCDVHDVASAFKRFLSGLPGGILGSLPLFDAFISIHTQFRGDPETTRTKQSKVRARLIALAIATLRSHLRRELICAVFGLLCMVGRVAETARREDDRGRPLPTTDLMGYGPLGIVFGPLLVGDLLEDYTMRLANPHGGLILLPISPPKSRKEKQKKSKSAEDDGSAAFNTHVDKVKVANSIAEMLITHWRDVVRHLRNLDALKIVSGNKSCASKAKAKPFLRSSVSEPFALRKPRDWDESRLPFAEPDRSNSPTPIRRINGPIEVLPDEISTLSHHELLSVRKQRLRQKPMLSHRLSRNRSLGILSPTVEEYQSEEPPSPPARLKNQLHLSSSSDKENIPPPLGLENPRTKFIVNSTTPNASNDRPSLQTPSSPHSEPAPVGVLKPTFVNSSPRVPPSSPFMPLLLPFTGCLKDERRSGLSETLDGVAVEDFPKDPAVSIQTSAEPLFRDGKIASRPTKPLGNAMAKFSSQELSDIYELLDGFPLMPPQTTQDFDTRVELLERKYPNTSAFIRNIDFHPEPRKPLEESIAKDLASQGLSKQIYESVVLPKGLQVPQARKRREIQTEAGSPTTAAAKYIRKFSRSYEDPKRIRLLRANQKIIPSRDPLSRISHQEDLASLATLAKVLDQSEGSPRTRPVHDTTVHKTTTFDGEATKVWSLINSVLPLASDTTPLKKNVPAIIPQSSSRAPIQKSKAPEDLAKVCDGQELKQSSKNADLASPVTPKRSGELKPKRGHDSSPSSKVSALVAKFSNATVAEKNILQTRGSPGKSNIKVTPSTPGTIKSRRESLIAPYTTNSSPARSQKSVNSEKTTLALRNSSSIDRQQKLQKLSGTFKPSSPSRLLRQPRGISPLPFQPSQAIPDTRVSPRQEKPSKPSNPFSVTLRPVRKSLEGKGSPTRSRPTSSSLASFSVSLRSVRNDCDRVVVLSEVNKHSQHQASIVPSQPPPCLSFKDEQPKFRVLQGQDLDSSKANSRGPALEMLSSAELQVTLENVINRRESTEHRSGLDGSTSETQKPTFESLETVDIVRPIPVPNTGASPGNDLRFINGSPPPRLANPPPTPSFQPQPGHSQRMKSLEQQLAAKTEQLQHLKRQLEEARELLDFETLGDELRDAKREIKRWKRRAELAEKQLEILTQYSTTATAATMGVSNIYGRMEGSSSCTTLPIHRFPTEYSLDSSKVDERLRRLLQGGDGAASPMEMGWGSEESTETVERRWGSEGG